MKIGNNINISSIDLNNLETTKLQKDIPNEKNPCIVCFGSYENK